MKYLPKDTTEFMKTIWNRRELDDPPKPAKRVKPAKAAKKRKGKK